MKSHRPTDLRPQLEALEGRDQPSANLPLADTFAVGTDAVPATANESTAAAFLPTGMPLSLGGVTAFSPPDFDLIDNAGHNIGFRGGIRTAVADFNGDRVQDLALAMGPTPHSAGVVDPTSRFSIFDGRTGGSLVARFLPFEGFSGGLFLAVGDVNNDGLADLAVSPDVSGGPRVAIYTFFGGQFVRIANFFAIDDSNFRGGCRPALGDLTGDGFDDVVVSAGYGGGPRISTYDGPKLLAGQFVHPVPDFFLFEDTLRDGAYVALGDVTGDGKADLIGGGGPGGGPRVLIVAGRSLLVDGAEKAIANPVRNFFAGDINSRGGVRVAAKQLNADRYADLVTGNGDGSFPQVRTYLGIDLAFAPDLGTSSNFNAFSTYSGGVFVG